MNRGQFEISFEFPKFYFKLNSNEEKGICFHFKKNVIFLNTPLLIML